MAAVYATLIIKGYKTFSQVPTVKKAEVAEILIACDCTELITDPAYLPVVEATE